ncbi:MAG: GbsR/MarR family transcriptional regulator [Cognaticolwellia sp.]
MSAKPETFIEGMGVVAQADGLPRIAGRLIGVMVLEQGPFSFSDLAIKLGVSRASISTNTRLLENMGVIERTGKAGDRQDYFQLADDPYVKLLHGLVFRMNKAKKLVDSTRKNLSDGAQQQRLQALQDFYHDMINSYHQLIEKMEQQA